MADDFSDLKVGDEIGVQVYYEGKVNRSYITTVVSVKPPNSFATETGIEFTGSRSAQRSLDHTFRCTRVTPEFREIARRSDLLTFLEFEADWESVPTDVLERIAEMVPEYAFDCEDTD